MNHKRAIISKLKDIKDLILVIVLIILWLLICLNPIIIAIYKSNPAWLLLYLVDPVEVSIGSLITTFITTIIK